MNILFEFTYETALMCQRKAAKAMYTHTQFPFVQISRNIYSSILQRSV